MQGVFDYTIFFLDVLKFYHFEFRGEFRHVDMQCAIYDHVHGVMSMFIKLSKGN
jgi:hypothetical protein